MEICCQKFDKLAVKVFTAQERVAIGRFHFENAVAHFEDRDIERTAAKVIDRDGFILILVHAICKRSGGWLVNDTQDFKTRNLARILRGLTLGVVEVRRNRDNGLRDGFAEIGLCCFLHFLKDERRNLRWRIIFSARLYPSVAILALDDIVRNKLRVLLGDWIVEAAADKALHCENRAFRIGHSLTLCRLSDQALTVLSKGHDRWRRTCAFRILDDLGLAAVHYRNAAVCRAQVDTNNFSHKNYTPKF